MKKKTKKPDVVIQCRKCGHYIYITKGAEMTGEKLWKKILKTDCPECGEEPDGNWTVAFLGDFDNR